MARSEARIFTRIWTDEQFTRRSPTAQWLYFYLLSQPGLTLCGVLDFNPARWARFAAGLTRAKLEVAIKELQTTAFIVIDNDSGEVWIRGFVKNDVRRGSPQLLVGLSRAWVTIVSDPIRSAVLNAVHDNFGDVLATNPPASIEPDFIDSYRKGYGIPHRDAPSDTPTHTPPDGVADTPTHTPSRTPLAGACAQPPSPSPSPSPPPSPPPGDTPSRHAVQPPADGTEHDDEDRPHPDQAVLDHIGTTIGWTTTRRRGELRAVWDWASAFLDRRLIEDTLLGCTDAKHPNYLRSALTNAALTNGVTVPEEPHP